MLSILIPLYNHNVKLLVNELHKQAILLDVPFEIIIVDDASTEVYPENYLLSQLHSCSVITLAENIGRSKMRNFLVTKANFDWLLFLDCDCMPDSNYFLQNYLNEIYDAKQKIVFGGLSKIDEKPKSTYSLRYKFNNFREVKNLEFRKHHPYQTLLSSNTLIHKSVFNKFSFNEDINKYGYEDYLFFREVEKSKIKVKHIENTVKHLNLDENSLFLKKTEESIEVLVFLMKTKKTLMKRNKIYNAYLTLKQLRLLSIFLWVFKRNKTIFKNNLCSNAPYLFIFDLYKLGIFCQLNTKK